MGGLEAGEKRAVFGIDARKGSDPPVAKTLIGAKPSMILQWIFSGLGEFLVACAASLVAFGCASFWICAGTGQSR